MWGFSRLGDGVLAWTLSNPYFYLPCISLPLESQWHWTGLLWLEDESSDVNSGPSVELGAKLKYFCPGQPRAAVLPN